jgi:hypothetical protein
MGFIKENVEVSIFWSYIYVCAVYVEGITDSIQKFENKRLKTHKKGGF